MQRARAAEGDERVVARIMAALDADHPDGPGHVGGDNGDDPLRRRHHVETKRLSEPSDGGLSEVAADRHAPAQKVGRVEGLEDDVGVGDGRLGAAPAVADRTRIGAGAARADLEEPP